MRALALICLLAGCGPRPPAGDAGFDGGSNPGHDAGPSFAGCAAARCAFRSGSWQVIFTGPVAEPLCRPPQEPIVLSSQTDRCCMSGAADAGSDGGCGFQFLTARMTDAGLRIVDTWTFEVSDAGHAYGTWATEVTGVAQCTATYNIHAVR